MTTVDDAVNHEPADPRRAQPARFEGEVVGDAAPSLDIITRAHAATTETKEEAHPDLRRISD